MHFLYHGFTRTASSSKLYVRFPFQYLRLASSRDCPFSLCLCSVQWLTMFVYLKGLWLRFLLCYIAKNLLILEYIVPRNFRFNQLSISYFGAYTFWQERLHEWKCFLVYGHILDLCVCCKSIIFLLTQWTLWRLQLLAQARLVVV